MRLYKRRKECIKKARLGLRDCGFFMAEHDWIRQIIPDMHDDSSALSRRRQLDLLASKAQLIRYRDHYYPKEEK